MENNHRQIIEDYLREEYDKVELKNNVFVCHLDFVDETHYITPVVYVNDDESKGYELIATKESINFTWEVGNVDVKQ